MTTKRRTLALAIMVAMTLAMPFAMPNAACAETRQIDMMFGTTVGDGGLDTASLLDVSAPRAIMIDSNGNVPFERNADEQCKVASTTKVMTVHLAVKYGNLDDVVTVSGDSAGIEGSTAGLQSGDRMTLRDLLMCAMLPSGNDAADAIARHVGRVINPNTTDAMSTFVQAMNDEASSMGMTNTLYTNPHGLDEPPYDGEHHSTARDLATLAKASMSDEPFKAVACKSEADVSVTGADGATRTIHLESTNPLLGTYGGAIGVKTGTTSLAGSCLVGAMDDGDQTYYTVVLGEADKEATFFDTRAMYDWAKAHDVAYDVAKGHDGTNVTIDDVTTTVPMMARVAIDDRIDTTIRAALDDWSRIVTYDVLGDVTQNVSFNRVSGEVHAGDVVGSVTYQQGDRVLSTRRLIAADSVEAPTEPELLAMFFGRMIRTMQGRTVTATSEVIPASDDADDGAFVTKAADAAGVGAMHATHKEPTTTINVETERHARDDTTTNRDASPS